MFLAVTWRLDSGVGRSGARRPVRKLLWESRQEMVMAAENEGRGPTGALSEVLQN